MQPSLEASAAVRLRPVADSAALIRPDGFVAWRSLALPNDPEATLRDVLQRVLFNS